MKFQITVWDGKEKIESFEMNFCVASNAEKFASEYQKDRDWSTRNICQVTCERVAE